MYLLYNEGKNLKAIFFWNILLPNIISMPNLMDIEWFPEAAS